MLIKSYERYIRRKIKISSKDEIIQEYLMHKLEIMSKYRFGIINILNVSLETLLSYYKFKK